MISDFNAVTHPEGVLGPSPTLNQKFLLLRNPRAFSPGRPCRYDRNTLLQFSSICKEKPAFFLSLDVIGLELLDPSSLNLACGHSHPLTRRPLVSVYHQAVYSKGPPSI